MCRHNWAEDRVYFHDDEGRLRSMPASWTSLKAADPVEALGGGRSPFRVLDLLELAGLIAGMHEAASGAQAQRGRRGRGVR
jgi:hypothetical protein